jgi:cold shock CspA family protein
VSGSQIFRIGDPDSPKNTGPGTKGLLNCVFTNCLPDSLVVAGEKFWNDSKGCHANEIYCQTCLEQGTATVGRNNIGSHYVIAELPDDCEPDTLGLDASLEQYCKLTHYRTHKVNGARIQSMMVLGTKARVESALAQSTGLLDRVIADGLSPLEQEQANQITQLKAQLMAAQQVKQPVRSSSKRPKSDSHQAPGERLIDGVVQRWDYERGYGFIKTINTTKKPQPSDRLTQQEQDKDENKEDDFFCHYTSIADGNELVVGTSVKFEKDLQPGTGKLNAKNVTGGRLVPRSKFKLPGGRSHASPMLRAFDRAMVDSEAEIETKDQASQFIAAMHERTFCFVLRLPSLLFRYQLTEV